MIYLLKDLMAGALKNGATEENAAIQIDVKLTNRKLAWVLNKLYGEPLMIGSYVGAKGAAGLVIHSSMWVAGDQEKI